MSIPNSTLEIRTLGHFGISLGGKAVATEWPDEATKLLFCSLLSPLDLYFTWDRICRSMLGVSATRTSKRLLEESFIGPLNAFLIRELGFTPLISGPEYLRLDQQRIHVDAGEFHRTAVEGLRLMALGNHVAARDKLDMAASLYVGIYLPGMTNKIINNTRNELDSLYRAAIIDAIPLARKSGCSS